MPRPFGRSVALRGAAATLGVLAVLAVALAALAAAPSQAARRGVVTLHYELYMGGYNLAQLPDGRLIASVTVRRGKRDVMGLLRFSARGRKDRRFGRRGIAEVRMGVGDFVEPTALLVQPDGRVVIAGTVTTTKRLVFGNSAFGGARFLPSGRLDRSFGNKGKATWTAGDKADYEPWLVRTLDGSILLGGGTQRGGTAGGTPYGCVIPLGTEFRQSPASPGFCAVPPGMSHANFPEGVSDGAGGAVVAVQGDQLVVGSGEEPPAHNAIFGIARVDSAGSLDESFGTGGYTLTDFGRRPSAGVEMGGTQIAARAGGWIVGGAAPTALGLVGFTAQGALDPGFGDGGKLALDPDPTKDPLILSKLVPLRDGRTLAIGSTFAETSGKPRRGFIAVLRPDGSLDPGFGRGGKLLLNGRSLGIEEVDSLYTAIEQSNGKIVVLGTAYRSLDDNIGLLMFRLRPNGTLDRSFGR